MFPFKWAYMWQLAVCNTCQPVVPLSTIFSHNSVYLMLMNALHVDVAKCRESNLLVCIHSPTHTHKHEKNLYIKKKKVYTCVHAADVQSSRI